METVFHSHLVVQVITGPLNFINSNPSVQRCVFTTDHMLKMKGEAVFALLMATVHLSCSCRQVNTVLVCSEILANFEPGCSTLLVTLRNVGEINSTVLQSEALASITVILSNNVGVTRIAAKAFSSFPNLQRLNLDDNLLSQINPDWFGNPAALGELELAGNRIEELNESSLDGLTNLTQLRLNKNRIQTIHPDSFSSQRRLADVDLSGNRLMWISAEVFRSLLSLRSIRLDGNPWNCSCDAKSFVTALKGLKDRNQLNNSLDVTCESPPSLKGQPVWDVSVCPAAPPDPSAPTPSKEPAASTANHVTSRPLQTSSKTETSVQSNLAHPPTFSSFTSSLPPSKASVGTKPTDAPTPSSAGTSSDTESSTNSKPTSKPESTSCSSPSPDPNHNTLTAVLVVLSVLLFVVCLLAVMQIRKCRNQTVMPVCPKGEQQQGEEELEEDSRSSRDRSQSGHPEVAHRSFTGIRAKSANAVILTSPFCVSEKDEVHFQMESEDPPEVSENPGEKKLVTESGAETGGGNELDHFTTTDVVSENQRPEHESRDLHENQEGVNADVVPYLSIGTVKNKPSPSEEATSGPERKVFRRSSTWPPSAAQWQERCKMKEEDDEFAVWTQKISVKLSDDVEHPSSSDQREKSQNQSDAHIPKLPDALQPNEPCVSELQEGGESPDPAESIIIVSCSKELSSMEHPAQNSSIKADVRKGPMRPENVRPKVEPRAAGSKAPSGGTSPDDETLLSGNEYVFMDLLHEVVENHGRWTRERWKQMRVNKQRR